jgi:hypothetical protein
MIGFFSTISAILVDPLFTAAYRAFSLLLDLPGVTFRALLRGIWNFF